MAGRNPDYVQAKMRTYILRKKGWNVDVPITSKNIIVVAKNNELDSIKK